MPAKIWTGTLSFVLVSIPVQLVSAVRRNRVSFRMMHKTDNSFLQRQMYCPKDNQIIHPEHIVNGYEVENEKYVIVRENEYKALEPKRSQSIEIESFIDIDEVDPIYFDRPYYIIPGKGGNKSYQMLRQVMTKTNKMGISRIVLHSREHLVIVRAKENLLELMTLHFHDQLRDTKEITPSIKPRQAEVKKLTSVIEQFKSDYDPKKYIDEHRKQVLEFLEQKVKQGQTITVQQPQEEEEHFPESETDLVAALEESLSKVKNK